MLELIGDWWPFLAIWGAVFGVLLLVAPLAIWVHAARAARSLKAQEKLLRDLVELAGGQANLDRLFGRR